MKILSKIIGVGLVLLGLFVLPGAAQVTEPGPCVWEADGFDAPCDFSGMFPGSVFTTLPLPEEEFLSATLSLTLTETLRGFTDDTLFIRYVGTLTTAVPFVVNTGAFETPIEVASVQYTVEGETEWIRENGRWNVVRRDSYDATVVASSLPCGGIGLDAVLGMVEIQDANDNQLTDLGNNTGLAMRFQFDTRSTKVVAECTAPDGFDRLDNPFTVTIDLGEGSVAMESTGIIEGQLQSAELIITTDDIDVQQATVELYRQSAGVRVRDANESIDEYIQVLAEGGRTLIDTMQVTTANMGKVSFQNLPIVDDNTNEVLLYTLQVNDAQSEVPDTIDPMIIRTVNFESNVESNLSADVANAVILHEIKLVRLEGYEVNSPGDLPDDNVADGVCDTGMTITDGRQECTLRAAIEQANQLQRMDLISFDIPGPPPHTIFPESKLPAIKAPVIIDGNTQPGPNLEEINALAKAASQSTRIRRAHSVGTQAGMPADPKVILDGSRAGRSHGYNLKIPRITIKNKRIVNFQKSGIKLTMKSGRSRITGNIIGVGQNGQPQPNQRGLLILSANNIIGGIAGVPGKAPGNVISGNREEEIKIEGKGATGNRVLGNVIGPDPLGTRAVESRQNGSGVWIEEAPGNVIGGVQAGAGNVLSGHIQGISVRGSDATANQILGNFIGVDRTGTKAIPNDQRGIQFVDASGNVIGGSTPGAGNVIAGNLSGEIVLFGNSNKNQVFGNRIGETTSGLPLAANRSGGIIVTSGKKNAIGGPNPGEGNQITSNNDSGITIGQGFPSSAKRNAVLSNNIRIINGPAFAIHLVSEGLNVNDPGDVDTGANNLQNWPGLLSARVSPGAIPDLDVTGLLDSTPGQTGYTIQIFTCTTSPSEVAYTFVGSVGVSTDAQGKGAFTFMQRSTNVKIGGFLAATATDLKGNTSELSFPCLEVK